MVVVYNTITDLDKLVVYLSLYIPIKLVYQIKLFIGE